MIFHYQKHTVLNYSSTFSTPKECPNKKIFLITIFFAVFGIAPPPSPSANTAIMAALVLLSSYLLLQIWQVDFLPLLDNVEPTFLCSTVGVLALVAWRDKTVTRDPPHYDDLKQSKSSRSTYTQTFSDFSNILRECTRTSKISAAATETVSF